MKNITEWQRIICSIEKCCSKKETERNFHLGCQLIVCVPYLSKLRIVKFIVKLKKISSDHVQIKTFASYAKNKKKGTRNFFCQLSNHQINKNISCHEYIFFLYL